MATPLFTWMIYTPIIEGLGFKVKVEVVLIYRAPYLSRESIPRSYDYKLIKPIRPLIIQGKICLV
jgi:hypothetical protein